MHFWETTSSRASVGQELLVGKYGTTPFLRLEQIVINATAFPNEISGRGALEKRVLKYALCVQNKISQSAAEFGVDGEGEHKRVYKLSDICYKPRGDGKCLVHSPLEYWGSDIARLESDEDHFRTLSNASIVSSIGIPIPLHSVFGGLQSEAASGSLLRADSIVLTYFLVEKSNVHSFREAVAEIWDRIWENARSTSVDEDFFKFHMPSAVTWRAIGETKHLYLEFGKTSTILTGESLVLSVMYLIAFLYISLVLGKMDLVKSKFALGFGAVVSVFSGFVMSVGLCSMLGVKTSLLPWEVLPFLIIVVGVENIHMLTKAVVLTSMDLPVKERVGLGLGKVGVSMSLSLGAEMCLLLISSTMSIPTLQEFCLFGAVSIVMDYFMQITFFVTILSIDIRRLELSELHKLRRKQVTLIERRPSVPGYIPVREEIVDEPPQTEGTSAGKSGRPHWVSYVIILGILLVAGFGLLGSSPSLIRTSEEHETIPSFAPPTPSKWTDIADGTQCVNSMCATADSFWEVLDPNRTAKYVEIRPPIYVIFDAALATSPESSTRIEAIVAEAPSEEWTPSSSMPTSPGRTFMKDSHPALFTLTIVLLLLFGVIMCVICTSLFLLIDQMKHYFVKATSAATVARSKDTNRGIKDGRDIGRPLSVQGGGLDDVEALTVLDDFIFWVGGDGHVRVWRKGHTPAGQRLPKGKTRGRVTCLSAYRGRDNINYIAIGTELGSVQVWDASSRLIVLEKEVCNTRPREVTRLCLGSIGLRTAICVGMVDGCVKVLLLSPANTVPLSVDNSGNIACVLKGHRGPIRDLQLDSRGRLFTGSDDQTTRCWTASENVQGGVNWSLTHTLHGHAAAVTCVRFDVESGLVVTGCANGEIYVWDIDNRKPVVKILPGNARGTSTNEGGHIGEITALLLLRTRQALTSVTYLLCSAASDERVKIWELTLTVPADEGTQVSGRTRSSSASAGTAIHRTVARRESFSSRDRAPLAGSQDVPYGLDENKACAPPSYTANLRYLGQIGQPGCSSIALEGSILLGARTVHDPSRGRNHKGTTGGVRLWEWLHKRKAHAPQTNAAHSEGEWWWEIWMADLTDLKDPTNVFRTLTLGEDELRGMGCVRHSNEGNKTPVTPTHPRGYRLTEEPMSTRGSGRGVARRSSVQGVEDINRSTSSLNPHDQQLSTNTCEGGTILPSTDPSNILPIKHQDTHFGDIIQRHPNRVNPCATDTRSDSTEQSMQPSRRMSTSSARVDDHQIPVDNQSNGQVEGVNIHRDSNDSIDLEHTDSISIASTSVDDSESTFSDSASSIGEDDESVHLPVLQVRAISVSSSAVAIGFGNVVKILLFDGDSEREDGDPKIRNGWVSYDGGGLYGKVHVA